MRGLVWAALCAAAGADAGLQASYYANGAFGGVPALVRTDASLDFVGSLPIAGQFVTARWIGSLQAARSDLFLFALNTTGGVRLWVDDHLLVDESASETTTAPQFAPAFLNISLAAGTTFPFRLEFTQLAAVPPVLQLFWSGNSTSLALVPASAFTTDVSSAEQTRQVLRESMYQSAGWGTHYNPNMLSHVLLPEGLDFRLDLLRTTDNSYLGAAIHVFRQFNPATVRPGAHSYNSSSGFYYTELTVSRWSPLANCSVSVETAVDFTTAFSAGTGLDTPFGAVDSGNLVVRASAAGSDCASLRLVLAPSLRYNHPGAVTLDPVLGVARIACPWLRNATFYPSSSILPVAGNASEVHFALGDGALLTFATGRVYAAEEVAAVLARNAAAHAAQANPFGSYWGDVYRGMQSVIAWNTMYDPHEGFTTPVSRGWDFGSGYVLFDWDNLFCALMTSLDNKNLAYQNAIQIIQARTMAGFVPNFASGLTKSRDRTEPMIGARVVWELFQRWGDAWVVDVVFDALFSWNTWFVTTRLGPNGLISLGSSPNVPFGGFDENDEQAARYESGLDNSPMYDGPDSQSQGLGPVQFDANTTHLMQLSDVGFNALFLSDTHALMALANATGRTAVLPTLQTRFNSIAKGMQTLLWSEADGAFVNRLWNASGTGDFYARFAPTTFYPLIAGLASDEQALSILARLTDPSQFNVQEWAFPTSTEVSSPLSSTRTLAPSATGSVTPGTQSRFLWQLWNSAVTDNALCAQEECVGLRLAESYSYVRVEGIGLVALESSEAVRDELRREAANTTLVPLLHYYSSANQDHMTTVPSLLPNDTSYEFVAVEGFCLSAPRAHPNLTTWLTLHWSAARKDFQTCGTPHCRSDASPANGYVPVGGTLCYALNATNVPSPHALPSIVRSDPAFSDNNYWRGRIWGPMVQLVYWGLEAYDHLPPARAARLALVEQSRFLMLQNWRATGHIHENFNGNDGDGNDVDSSDPFYHWGALTGFVGLTENGFFGARSAWRGR